jgi:hypothetical protein
METKKELTVKELGRVFELFQKVHPDCPYMRLEIDATMAGTGVRPGIYYGVGRHDCYIASYSTRSVEALYELMKKDIGEIEEGEQFYGGYASEKRYVIEGCINRGEA